MTIFWLKLVQGAIEDLDSQTSLVQTTNAVLSHLANQAVVNEYYSVARLTSESARSGWAEPDLKHL